MGATRCSEREGGELCGCLSFAALGHVVLGAAEGQHTAAHFSWLEVEACYASAAALIP